MPKKSEKIIWNPLTHMYCQNVILMSGGGESKVYMCHKTDNIDIFIAFVQDRIEERDSDIKRYNLTEGGGQSYKKEIGHRTN